MNHQTLWYAMLCYILLYIFCQSQVTSHPVRLCFLWGPVPTDGNSNALSKAHSPLGLCEGNPSYRVLAGSFHQVYDWKWNALCCCRPVSHLPFEKRHAEIEAWIGHMKCRSSCDNYSVTAVFKRRTGQVLVLDLFDLGGGFAICKPNSHQPTKSIAGPWPYRKTMCILVLQAVSNNSSFSYSLRVWSKS